MFNLSPVISLVGIDHIQAFIISKTFFMPDFSIKRLRDIKLIRTLHSNESQIEFKFDTVGTIVRQIVNLPEINSKKSDQLNYPICNECNGYFIYHSNQKIYSKDSKGLINYVPFGKKEVNVHSTSFQNRKLISYNFPLLWPTISKQLNNKLRDVIEANSLEESFKMLNLKGEEIFPQIHNSVPFHPIVELGNGMKSDKCSSESIGQTLSHIQPCSCMINVADGISNNHQLPEKVKRLTKDILIKDEKNFKNYLTTSVYRFYLDENHRIKRFLSYLVHE